MKPGSRPEISVREEQESATLVVSGDWTTQNLAELPQTGSYDSSDHPEIDCSELGRVDSVGALAILTLVPGAAKT